jgi:hypothetical protein
MFRTHWFIGGWLTFLAYLLFVPASAFAQWSPSSKHPLLRYGYNPGYYGNTSLTIPPAARGYQATMMIQQHQAVAERIAAMTPPPPRFTAVPAEPVSNSFAVGITPSSSQPMTVAIRGPDGEVRRFPVSSPEAIRPRTIIVRPGEKLRITLDGSIRVQIQQK